MIVNTLLLMVLSLIVGLLRGGKVRNIADVKIKYMWVAIAAFILQFTAIFLDDTLVHIVDIVSYAVILIFAFVNRKNIGILLVLIGVTMNYVVMIVNNGRMPVFLPDAKLVAPKAAVQSLIHGTYGKQIVMSAHTHLNFLGDIFYIPHPFPNPTLLSAGDLVVAIGVFLFLQLAMGKPIEESQGELNRES